MICLIEGVMNLSSKVSMFLNRTSIEDYLIHDEVLKKFADSNSLDENQLQALKEH